MKTLVDLMTVLRVELYIEGSKITGDIVTYEEAKRDYDSSWKIWGSGPDREKYKDLLVVKNTVNLMTDIVGDLDKSFGTAEIQLKLCVEHLKSTKRSLSGVYNQLVLTLDHVQDKQSELNVERQLSCVDQKDSNFVFTDEELSFLEEKIDAVQAKIEEVRQNNSPVARAISMSGFAAISDE